MNRRRPLLLVLALAAAAGCGNGEDPLVSAASTVESTTTVTAANTTTSDSRRVNEIDVLFDDQSARRFAPEGMGVVFRMIDGDIDPTATTPDLLPVSMLSLARWTQADGTWEYTANQYSASEDGLFSSCGSPQGLVQFSSATEAVWQRDVRPARGGFEDSMEECEPFDQLTGFEYVLEGPLTLSVVGDQQLSLTASDRTVIYKLTVDPRVSARESDTDGPTMEPATTTIQEQGDS